ncbi:MAG: HdeD family acid-resistance protein [Thermoleophilia bacterium]
MGEQAARGDVGTPPMAWEPRETTDYWWLWVVAGISWIIISVVILQFDEASVRTVGVIIGLMFLLAGFQNLALAGPPVPLRWVWVCFGLLFVAAGLVCLANPEDTFAALADILGFLFLLVGVWWMVRAFLEWAFNPLWWLGLVAGILMSVLAFWTAGQFFIEKAYILLVFAGIWALMEGIGDIARAFAVRGLHRAG